MDLFKKIITAEEIYQILATQDTSDSIPIGEITEHEAQKVITLMNLWCERIDKIIALDIEVNGKPTWRTNEINPSRGFTYHEYTDLFNKHIIPDEFPFYAIFNQLRQKKGGINTEKQRTHFTFHYELHEDDYVRILLEQGYHHVLSFFFGGLAKFDAYLPLKKLFMHSVLIAPSGSGKTVLMETMFFRMTKRFKKFSFILIDPHGDISKRAKNHKHLIDRCIYIDPFLRDGFTPTFNPFNIKDRSLRNINNVAEQIILAFEEILSREGGDLTETMTNMLEKCVYFLLKRPNSTILDLVKLLDRDEQLFDEAAQVDKFFDDFYLKQNNKTREGLLNRIGRLLNSPILLNLLGGQSTFDLEKAITRSNKVVIFNLGGLGEMTQIAFGKFIIANIKSIVRKRDKPSKKHTFCFIDEAHNFVTGSFETILSQLRGFGLHMVLANQFVEQYGNQAKSVKQNSAVKILGGSEDNLEDMKKMVKLPKEATLKDYEFYLKVTGRTMLKFKSPSLLLRNPKKYYLSKKNEKELDKYLISRYYKAFGQEEIPVRTIAEVDEPPPTDSPSPDLGLYINADDKAT